MRCDSPKSSGGGGGSGSGVGGSGNCGIGGGGLNNSNHGGGGNDDGGSIAGSIGSTSSLLIDRNDVGGSGSDNIRNGVDDDEELRSVIAVIR